MIDINAVIEIEPIEITATVDLTPAEAVTVDQDTIIGAGTVADPYRVGFTPEIQSNKVTAISESPSDDRYMSEKLVVDLFKQLAPEITIDSSESVWNTEGTEATITVTASGGLGELNYKLDDTVNATGIFTVIQSGIYSIRVEDILHNFKNLSVEVEEFIRDLYINNLVVTEGYIPIANEDEFFNIRSTANNIFGEGTMWEGLRNGGVTAKKYVLVNSISLAKYDNWVHHGAALCTIDGAGYSITDLKIISISTGLGGIGLFTGILKCNIKNLFLNNIDVQAPWGATNPTVGGLCGINEGSLVENVKVSGYIQGYYQCGMIAGLATEYLDSTNYHFKNCSAIGVIRSINRVSGIHGDYGTPGTSENCYSAVKYIDYNDTSNNVGAICSRTGTNLINCYYNKEVDIDRGDTRGVGKTTTQMKEGLIDAVDIYTGWNSNEWDAINIYNYPELKIFADRFSTQYNIFLSKNDINNEVTNNVIDETRNYTPKYLTNSFVCPTPIEIDNPRRAFPNIMKSEGYAFLTYLARESHSPSALKPPKLQFARSNDLFRTTEVLPVKCINDGGVMREIIPLTDGFFVSQTSMVEADNKIWMLIPTFNFTVNPPVTGSDWDSYKSFITHSSDNGDTWNELIEIDATDTLVPSSKPIVVGNEIWFSGYNTGNSALGATIADLHSWLIKYNYTTQAVTKIQIDTSWTGLSTTEPAVLEYATGKFMCVARVNWNANYPGEELTNKGVVIAYSTDGLDWSNYEFKNWGGQFPNQPKLFMYKGHVYFMNVSTMYHGVPSTDGSQIDWIQKNANPDWRLAHGYVMMAYEAASGGALYRKDPRAGNETNPVTLTRVGGLDMCVWDEDKDILLATIGYHNDQAGIYLAEPWVGIIKPNPVMSDGTLTNRLIFMTEIPGDNDTSNTITIHNSYIEETDTIVCRWEDAAMDDISIIGVRSAAQKITFTAGSAVTKARLIYEIIKAS